MKKRSMVLNQGLVLASLAAGMVLAAEGRIPIYQQTTIATPGKYVVTRNLSTAAAPLIDIQVSNVDIDLNGMELRSTSTTDPVVRTSGGGVSIRNGKIVGGNEGILLAGVEGGTIEGNEIRSSAGAGIALTGTRNVAVLDNRLNRPGGSGILISGSGGNLISGNTMNEPIGDGIKLESSSSSNRVSGNLILGASGNGIYLSHSQNQINYYNRIDNNHVVSTGGSAALRVESTSNYIEGNTLHRTPNGWGIWFKPTADSTAGGNVYQRNTARDNSGSGCTGTTGSGGTADLCDEATTSNVSGGDNFVPGPPPS